MDYGKIAVLSLSIALLGFNVSCSKNFGDEQACQTCTEQDLNAPIDGNIGEGEIAPPAINPPVEGETTKTDYSYVDPTHMVPPAPLAIALRYFDANNSSITNKNYLVVIDFTQNASQKRMYLINMNTGAVTKNLTSAGSGSDPDGDGNATLFSNTPESKKSSLGFYITGATYQGAHGLSLRLHGMSPTNSKAYDRAIVMHGADYVNESGNWAGRSWGCPAVDNALIASHIAKIKNGALMYAWHKNYSTEK